MMQRVYYDYKTISKSIHTIHSIDIEQTSNSLTICYLNSSVYSLMSAIRSSVLSNIPPHVIV